MRLRPVIALEISTTLSSVANAMVLLVLPWLVLERTGSATAAGLVAAVGGVSMVLTAPLSGVLIDRFGRRRIAMLSDGLSALSVAAFPLLDARFELALPALITLSVLGAAMDPAAYTARKSLVPSVARVSGQDLAGLNGLHEAMHLVGWTLGPLLAAVSIATVGSVTTLGLATAPFLAAIVAVWAVGDTAEEPDDPAVLPGAAVLATRASVAQRDALGATRARDRTGALQETLEGVRLLRADRTLVVLTLIVMVLFAIYIPNETVLLPVMFEALDLPQGLGIAIALLAGGSAVGSLAFGWLDRDVGRRRTIRVGLVLVAAGMLAIAVGTSLVTVAIGCLAVGLGFGPVSPMLNLMVQERMPVEAHGRVFGLQLGLITAAGPLSQFIAGVSTDRLGLSTTYLVVAGSFALAVAIAVALPEVRTLPGPARTARVR